MRIFRGKFKDRRSGKMLESPVYSIDFIDHTKTRQRISTATDDEELAEVFGKHVAELVKARRRGVLPPDGTHEWLRDLDGALQEKLISLDLAKPAWCPAVHRQDELLEHVQAFEAWLRTSKYRHGFNRNEQHVQRTMQRVRDIIRGCRFKAWADIKRATVESYLGTLRQKPKSKRPDQEPTEPISRTTYNAYLASLKFFCRWVVEDGRAEFSPVAFSKRVKPDGEKRRALDQDDMAKLITITATGPERQGLAGHDRGVVYIMAAVSGFRVNELRSLKAGDFDLRRMRVRLAPEFCKDRCEAVQEIPYRFRDGLSAYLQDKDPSGQAFPIGPWCRTADMIREDARAAGIDLKDEDGAELAFHSLRHTLRTALATKGVAEVVIDKIMRHKAQGLGKRTYTHVTNLQVRAAIERLPEWPWPSRAAAEKQGVA